MDIEKTLGFNKIKDLWAGLALTKSAKEKIAGITFFLSEVELRKSLKDTTDSRLMIEQCGTPPLADLEDIPGIIAQSATGNPLTPHQLEKVETVLATVKRLKNYLSSGRRYNNSLAYYDENFNLLDEIRESISAQIRNGKVDSHASKELLQIRNTIIRTEEKIKQKAEQVMRSHKDCMADNYYTYRNGILCIPVKKECKSKIPGNVTGRSATGNTLFIEPLAVAKYYDELQSLKIDEENEVYRILYTLTSLVYSNIDIFEQNTRMMEKLDFIFSKGKLSIDMDATEPEVNTGRRLWLTNARHPLMDIRTCVPLQIKMDGDTKGIVITGPNTGGKTVAIKTVALNCLMAQCGLHVTCEKADICMNNAYLCDIGDGQDISQNLSTFSAHIKNVLEILKKAGRESLVIMDEPGSGTDPAEGMGIAIAILEELRKCGCLFLVTTHYPEAKEYALDTENIINACMVFDRETLMPTYRLVAGQAGESCAFYIAGKLGMPGRILYTAACAAYGKETADSYNFNIDGDIDKENQEKGTSVYNMHQKTKIKKIHKSTKKGNLNIKYNTGDSVMVYPDKKTGIVCEPVNDKGVLRVQLPDKKIWINHKRVKLLVAAEKLYPEGYDFSIIFDTVENRKARHEMERKVTDKVIRYDSPDSY